MMSLPYILMSCCYYVSIYDVMFHYDIISLFYDVILQVGPTYAIQRLSWIPT